MKRTLALIVTVLAFAITTTVNAAEPLVDKEWVKENLGKPGIVFVDIRIKPNYLAGHIPGAVHTNYKDWRVHETGGGTEKNYLEALVGGLGIGNESHVVLITDGVYTGEVATATHIFWVLEYLGHENTSILNGGMTAYMAGKSYPIARREYKRKSVPFASNISAGFLATTDDVRKALDGGAVLIDNRSRKQFLGQSKSSLVKRAGTIPGAKNIPISEFTISGEGMFLKPSSIKLVYEGAGVPTEGATINFSNTALMSSIGWFVSHELLGNQNAKMYRGSIAEWSADDSNPMEVR